MSMHLDLIWEDPHGLAVNKPAGLLTHPAGRASDEPTLEAMVRQLPPPRRSRVGLPRDGPPPRPAGLGRHPLGQDSQGRAPLGEPVRQAAAPQRILGDRRPTGSTGRTPGRRLGRLARRPDRSGRARVVAERDSGSVRAITRGRTGRSLRPSDRASPGFELYPSTGRTHQLRAQAAARGARSSATRPTARTAFDAGIALACPEL